MQKKRIGKPVFDTVTSSVGKEWDVVYSLRNRSWINVKWEPIGKSRPTNIISLSSAHRATEPADAAPRLDYSLVSQLVPYID